MECHKEYIIIAPLTAHEYECLPNRNYNRYSELNYVVKIYFYRSFAASN
jgi:hypothetical protein